MPERLFAAVRAYFRKHLWHPHYDAPTAQLVEAILQAGVQRFACMAYAHRGDMARSLNHWISNVQNTFAPHAIGFATFHPDDGEAIGSIAQEAFSTLKLRGAKLHPQVGNFALDDPRLDPLYERLSTRGLPLVVHAGRKPEPSEHTGARAFARFMRRYPSLTVVVAHAGADEFDAFFDLCGIYANLYLDTAMVFNKYLGGPPPIQRVLEFQDRVVFGSDFPNIPYRLETAIDSIKQLRLGRALEEKILCTNAARLLNLSPAELTTHDEPTTSQEEPRGV
jgi:uncharacterized protein